MIKLEQYKKILDYSLEELKTLEGRKKWLNNEPIKCKEALLDYLKNGTMYAVSSPCEKVDMITGEKYRVWLYGFTDGVYGWGTEDIRYFDKYNIKLKKEFIEHFKSLGRTERIYELPELFLYN